MSDRRWIVPILILGLATLFRLPSMLWHVFDQDEIYTLHESIDLFSTTLVPGIDARPVYYLLQHSLLGLVPHTEVGLRILPLAFGLAGVFLTWHVATRLGGTVAGIISGLIVAAAPWHVYVSTTARYYSLVYLLSIGFFYCFARAAEEGSQYRWHALALLALILGASTHPTFVFPAFGGAALLVLGSWTWTRLSEVDTRSLILRIAIPFGGFLVVAFAILRSLGRESAVRNLDGRGWTAVLRLLPGVVEWMTPVILVAGVGTAFWLLWTSSRRTDLLWGLMTIGGVGVAFVLLFFAAMVTNVYPYYATAMLPLIFVAIGIGAQRLYAMLPPPRRGLTLAILALILFAGMAPGTASQILHGNKFDYRPAFEQIREEAPDELVLAWPVVVQRHYAPEFRSREFHPDAGYLQNVLDDEASFWAIASRRRNGLVGDNRQEDGRRWLSRECREMNAFQGRRLDFRFYEVILYRCGSP